MVPYRILFLYSPTKFLWNWMHNDRLIPTPLKGTLNENWKHFIFLISLIFLMFAVWTPAEMWTVCACSAAHSILQTYHMTCRTGWSTQLKTGAASVLATSSSCIPVFHLLIAVGDSWAVACVTSKYRLSVLWMRKHFIHLDSLLIQTAVLVLQWKMKCTNRWR